MSRRKNESRILEKQYPAFDKTFPYLIQVETKNPELFEKVVNEKYQKSPIAKYIDGRKAFPPAVTLAVELKKLLQSVMKGTGYADIKVSVSLKEARAFKQNVFILSQTYVLQTYEQALKTAQELIKNIAALDKDYLDFLNKIKSIENLDDKLKNIRIRDNQSEYEGMRLDLIRKLDQNLDKLSAIKKEEIRSALKNPVKTELVNSVQKPQQRLVVATKTPTPPRLVPPTPFTGHQLGSKKKVLLPRPQPKVVVSKSRTTTAKNT
jgi:hypothetical protein